MERIAGRCTCSDGCPAVYTDDEDTDTVIVQGYEAGDLAVLPPTPDGEARVRVPRSLLTDAAERLRRPVRGDRSS